MGIKGNEEARKVAKEVINRYDRGLETPNGKGNEKTILVSYTTLNHILKWKSSHNSCRQYDVKLSRIRIGQTR